MRYLHIIILLLAFISCKNSRTPQESNVKIFLDTEEALSEKDTIYLTGNIQTLGTWNPKGLAMTRRSESRWEKTFQVPVHTKLEFKFTLGSYEREAITNRGMIPANNQMEVLADTEVYFVLEDWKNPFAPVTVTGGKADLHMVSPGNGLAARKVTVWLPDDYSNSEHKKYPVLYLHDGQNQFDATKAFNGQEWKIDETLTLLAKQNKISTPICVAIDNTLAREEEYGSVTDKSLYADFIVNQLKPLIDSLYRTLPDRKNTGTMGSSMGGLIAFNLAWYHNDIFSKAACFSPSFHYKNFDLAAELKKYKGPKKDLQLYVDNGTVGVEAQLQTGIDETINYLKSQGYQINYKIEQGAEHNEAAWSKRTTQPLLQFFGVKK